MKQYVSNRSLAALAPFALGVSLAACGASADEEGASASAPGVSATAAGTGVSASAPGVSAQANKNGASANAGPVEVGAAQQALTELTGNVDLAVDGFKPGSTTASPPPPPSGADDERGDEGAATQTINVPCAAGGDADLDGYVNVIPAPVAVDVKVAIAFNACATRSGNTIDGNINFSQTLATTTATGQRDGDALQIETIYQGDVRLSGNVDVTCPVDLNVLVDETGRAVKVQGMFCNEDASELNLQVQPRWQSK